MTHYDLVVLGGGSAGLGAAQAARQGGRSVALVEADRTGGDCTFSGCVPSKTLLETARRVAGAREGAQRGFVADVAVDFGAVMAHVRGVVEQVARDESPRRLRRGGIDVLHGWGRFTSPREIAVAPTAAAPDDQATTLTFDHVLVATGGRAAAPPVPGLHDGPFLDNSSVFALTEQPRHLVVLGGGPIGCELAQAFRRLGSEVTLVEGAPRLLTKEEPEASRVLLEVLQREGVRVLLGQQASRVEHGDGSVTVQVGDEAVVGSTLLLALGRRPVTDTVGAQQGGVRLGQHGEVVVDAFLRSSNPRVFAAGDCSSALQLTHVADEQGRLAARNMVATTALGGRVPWALGGPEAFDDRGVPWTTFTSPEVGRVGLTEAQAYERWGAGAMVSFVPLSTQDRARASGETDGFVKLVAAPLLPPLARLGPVALRLVGMTAVAPTGGELAAEGALALRSRTLLATVARTVHAYPTWSLTTRVAAAQFFGGYGGRVARSARPERDGPDPA